MNRHVTSTDGTIVPSLLDYLSVVGRRKLLFLLIALLVPVTAIAVSLVQAPTYRASAEVLLESRELGTTYIDPQRVAETRAKLARVPAVVDRVLAEVPSAGLDRKEFLESSSVTATLGSDILTFSVENSDPDLATQLATEYATAFTDYQQELDNQAIEGDLDQVHQQLAQLEARGEGPGSPNYEALQRREETLAAAAAAQTRTAQVVNPAGEAPKVGPRTVRNALLALCLGVILALVVVFLVDALDTRVRSVDTIRETLGLRLLGRLAPPPSGLRKDNGLVMLADPSSREAEQFRSLRWSLDLANAGHDARTVMVTSAVDAEGKSTTVANLAVALTRTGRRVVLIDADPTHPQLHLLFKLDQQPGLTDVELGGTQLEEALRPVGLTEDSAADDSGGRTPHSGSLEVLPGGSALLDPDELAFDRAVARILQRVRDRAEIVLVDGPPILSSQAVALSAHVDAIIVVVRLNALRTSALEDLGWMLEESPATKLGFVLTGDDKRDGYGRQRFGAPARRREASPQPAPGVPPSAADGDGRMPSPSGWRNRGEASQPVSVRTCPNCGQATRDDDRFCPSCGQPTDPRRASAVVPDA